ncbi:hypothetical protein Fmac_011819 [Flemingia macrophylla]|uniref:Disease resistance protein At4g27190-like leucine-rich repeats domain-containing protein n=1 Tax=Flemingia macrophylla TaxID=520843 RepID=A0ABD1MNI2_9FABA
MVGRFKSLCNLKVTNCKSMKEIFDLKGCGKCDADMTNLQNIHVQVLPKLEHVWNKESEGIIHIKTLKEIRVQECLKLKHIFPVSVAMDLKNLENLEVWNCGQLKEIVSMEEIVNAGIISFEFPKLTTTRFSELPNLESFYRGAHELRCPTLNNLYVELCHKLKLFRTEIENSEIKPNFLTEEVIYNLKSMQVDPSDANLLSTYIGNSRMHKLEEFRLSRLLDNEILYFFLNRNPNLKSLLLSNCLFEQLATPRSLIEEKSGVVPRLKSLKLINLPSLKMIGFEEDKILFQRLECLILKQCPCLNTIAPASVSFTYLKNLEVSHCNKLRYLITPSTARSLVQLTTLKVIQCELMKTIVSEQENEERIISKKLKETELRIIFKQLKEIELVALHKLESFSSSIYAFDFPSLEKVVVGSCGNMKSFTFSKQDNKTPILRQICVRRGREENICYWKGDLNATIQHMYTIWAIDPSDMAASNPYKPLESSRLKTLKLAKCELGLHAIPTVVFPSLKNLEELEVSDTKVQVIFGSITETDMKGYTFPLKKLTLRGLADLRDIWVWDWDYEGFLSFQNLQEVLVTNCLGLKTLFPVEIGKRFEKLKKLEIMKCVKLQTIVKQEDEIIEETKEFSFPCLTSLSLSTLPELTGFYPGRYTLECPELNHLEVFFCVNLETFQRRHETGGSTSLIRQPLFSEQKAVFILESLKLDGKDTMTLCDGNFPEDMLNELVELELDFDKFMLNFPFGLLERASSLEYLQINRCRGVEELFFSPHERREIPVCKKLQKLRVSGCPDLTTLLHSAVSFSNLKQLSVKDCRKLRYLFTSATARQLVFLEEIYAENCPSMKEIILEEELDGNISEAIKFDLLTTIFLDSLPLLRCFYSGKETLQLSSLIRVFLTNCPRMRMFSQGNIRADSFMGIQISFDPMEDLLLDQDLNTTVNWIFRAQNFFKDLLSIELNLGTSYYRLRDDNIHNHLWKKAFLHGRTGSLTQNNWLHDLVTLKLRSSIPTEFLFHLKNLEEMEVCDSDKVEVIFYMNHQIMEITSGLKKLSFKRLSKLMRVWENSEGVHSFQDLKDVVVSECENLQTLFPVSFAKYLEKLEKLEIESCQKLQAIVGKEEGKTTNETERLVFHSLEKLDLVDLPQLAYFYSQTFTLECPVLTNLCVLNCHKLELFQSEGISIDGLPIDVISNLKKLALDCKHIWTLSLMFSSDKFIEGLGKLEELSLYLGADKNEKPVLHIERLQKAPYLMEMSINCDRPDIFLAANPKIGDEMLGQLKILTLCVSNLQSIKSEDSSWLNTICENLQELNVEGCPHLTTLVTSTLSFSCLKKVFISNCPELKYLFTSLAARMLKTLEEITVENCESVKEIVAKESDLTAEAIKFERLNTIALYSLPSLICFYSGPDALQLSSLITVHIRRCPNFKIFSQGLIYAESFHGIQMSSDPRQNQDLLFHQDLNTTLTVKSQPTEHSGWMLEFFDAIVKTRFPLNPWLKADHLGNVSVRIQNEWLRNLGALNLSECILPYVIPSAILHLLNNLEKLEVVDTNKVKVIFDMNDTQIMETPSQLKKLTLSGLSDLTHVWGNNTKGVLIFSNLQEVVVANCKNLQTLFPAALAKNLEKLEKLEIKVCHKLQEIVEKEENLMNLEEITVKDCGSAREIVAKERDEDEHKDGEDKYENEMIFWKLKILNLESLPKFESFYSGSSTLNFPSLKEVKFTKCCREKIFRHGDKVPAKLNVTIDGVHWEGDVNSVIIQQFEEFVSA